MNNRTQKQFVYWLKSVRSHTFDKPEQQLELGSSHTVLVYVDQGEFSVYSESQQWEVHAGQFIYFPGNEAFSIHSVGITSACYVLCVEALLLSQEGEHWKAQPQHHIPFIDAAGPLPFIGDERFRKHIKDISSANSDEADWPFQKLLCDLYEQLKNRPIHFVPQSGIEQSIAYMHTHYQEKISRDLLAQIAGLAPNSYWRSFKRTKGISPTAYLQQIRVEQAKAHLSEGMPLKQAADASGFGNEFYMSRVFKKWTGLSPTLYVKRHTLKVAVASRLQFQDSLHALGIEPVIAVDCYKHPLVPDTIYNAQLLRQFAELRTANPDLIIADYSHIAFHDDMKTIAPTVFIDHSLEWESPFLQIADLVNRRQEAEQTIGQVEERVTRYAQQIASRNANLSLTMLQVLHDSIMLQGTVCHPLNELLYTELKLKPGSHTPIKEMRKYLQSQDVPPFQSDYICVRLYKEHPLVLQMWNRMQQLPVWNDLPAVKGGRLHLTGNWLVESWTPQGRIQIAEDITSIIAPN